MQNRKKIVKAVLCAALAVVMAAAAPFPVSHAEESVLELQAQYDKLEQEIKKNQQRLEEKEQDKSEQKAVVQEIESEISGLSDQITILNKKIDLLNAEIGGLNSSVETLDHDMAVLGEQIEQARVNIDESQKQIDSTYQKLMDRLTKSYMAGTASSLELLFGAKSLADVLTWEQYIQNATEYDDKMIHELQTNIDALQEMEAQLDAAVIDMNAKKEEAQQQKKDLEEKQADVNSSADTLSVKKNTANNKRIEAYSLLKTMDSESKEFKLLDEQMRAEEERIDAEMNARLAKIASVQSEPEPVAAETTTEGFTLPQITFTLPDLENAESTTMPAEQAIDEDGSDPDDPAEPEETSAGTTTTTTQPQTMAPSAVITTSPKDRGLICPIQNPHAIVSGTYPNYQSGGVHHGIDIVVTDQGKTLGHNIVAPQSGKVITVGYGDASRGNYMEIDHGEGLVTRYYHCSTLLVGLGQTVTKGQVIGKVGDTGNATGPHLHFEILLNTKNGLIRQNPLSYISVP